jgi:hypothetical protein
MVAPSVMPGAFTGGDAESSARQLRPLGVGEVLDAAIKLYARNARTLWRVVAVVIVPLVLIQQIVIGASLPSGAFVHNGALYTPTGSLGTPAAGETAEIALAVLAALIVNGALALCLVDAYVGRPLDWRESLQAAADRLGSLLLLSILYGALVVLAFIVLILPGIWLSVIWCVAVPALMFEQVSGFKALERSFELVRGRWWATFAELLVTGIMLFIVLVVVGLIFGGIESGLDVSSTGPWFVLNGLSAVLSDLIVYPFIGSVIAVVYIDQRVRKEALDIDRLAGALGRTTARTKPSEPPWPPAE